MTILGKFQKLDHTCCMNSDRLEYGLSDCDCSSIDEMVDILKDVEKALKALVILKKTCVVHLKTIGEECFIADSEYLIHIRKDNYYLLKEVLE